MKKFNIISLIILSVFIFSCVSTKHAEDSSWMPKKGKNAVIITKSSVAKL